MYDSAKVLVRKWVWVASVLLGLATILWAPQAFAATSGYPYAETPCVWAPYTVVSTASNWCPDYDWGYVANSTSAASIISPYGYSYRNCTDYTAWRVGTLGVGEAQYKGLGNAKDWVVKAPAKGLLVDGTPAVGSVAVRTTGAYGHTAFVEELNPAGYPAGTIRVSQYNYRGDGNYSEQIGTPASLGLLAFIHFEVYMPAPAITLAADPPAPEPAVSVSVEPSATPLAEETTGTLEPQLEVTGTAPLAEEEQAVIEASPAPTGLLADEIADPPATERQVQQEPKPEAKLVAAESPPITAAVASDISQPLPGQTQLRQATGSPPTVAPAKLARYNKTIDNNVPQIPDAPAPFSYWPLMGLLGVVLVREAALRPYPRSYHPA